MSFERIRWSDSDRHLGPITVAWGQPEFGLVLRSKGDEDAPAYGRLHLSRLTVLWPMPSWLIRPHREKIIAKSWDAGTVERLGRDWYWQIDRRAYGFTVSDGTLFLKFGRQTGDSWTDQSRCIFLPWKEWRHVRHSFYDMDGDLFADVPDRDWDARQMLEVACPTVRFQFRDFDGEEITATTRIEERQWKRGEGRFKWLSWFVRDKVRRSLDIRFSAEVGERKGSWKGGTIGTGIEMLPGELHEAAFRRYCGQNGMTFIGRAEAVEGAAS